LDNQKSKGVVNSLWIEKKLPPAHLSSLPCIVSIALATPPQWALLHHWMRLHGWRFPLL